MRVVQLAGPSNDRKAALVDGDVLRLITWFDSVYSLARAAIERKASLEEIISQHAFGPAISYDTVYGLQSDWKLLPAFDHPHEPSRCLVSGTGLTHKKSAESRQAMHAGAEQLSDSMRVYYWGVEGGRPEPGRIGVAPEWFYKGCGTILRAHGEPLLVPAYAEDGGDEPEIAGIYIIAPDGRPRRVGMAMGNEFSDHSMEKRNYLFLAPSKLRTCSIGPEIIIDGDFTSVRGSVSVERVGNPIWSKTIATGESNMSHTVANLEHHHFKYAQHRRPGDAHVHFFGADAFSFGDGVELEDGDVMVISFEGFGRPLRNPIRIDRREPEFVPVEPL